jgi:hypothetical protein
MIQRHQPRTGRRRLSCGLLFAAVLLSAPLAAGAQTPPPGPGGHPPMSATAAVDQQIAQLRRALRITPAQEPQFTAFTAVMRDNAQHADSVMAQERDPRTLNALEDMRQYTTMQVAHAEDMQKLLPAFEALYNSLSPPQQKQADAFFRQAEDQRRG